MRAPIGIIFAMLFASPALATSPATCPLSKAVTLTGTVHGLRPATGGGVEFALELERPWCGLDVFRTVVERGPQCADGDTAAVFGALEKTGRGKEIVFTAHRPPKCTAMPHPSPPPPK